MAKTGIEGKLLAAIEDFLPELKITIDDLKNPTQSFVCQFYTMYLEELGVNTSNITTMQSGQMQILEFKDMHNEILQMTNLYLSVRYFITTVSNLQFYISDLVTPDSKRTIAHLQVLIDFLSYADVKIADIQTRLHEIDARSKLREELSSKIITSKTEINKRALERVDRKNKIVELESTVEKDRQRRAELYNEKENQKSIYENIKKEVMKCEEEESKLVGIIRNIENENRKLKSEIVKSPEKLKQSLSRLQESKEAKEKDLKDIKNSLEEKKKLRNVYVRECLKQTSRTEILNELLKTQKSYSDRVAELEAARAQCAKIEEKQVEIKQKISNEEYKLQGLKVNFEEFKKRREMKDAENKETLISLKSKLEKQKKKGVERSALISELKASIDEFQNKLEEADSDGMTILESYKEELIKIKKMEETLERDFQAFTSKIKFNSSE